MTRRFDLVAPMFSAALLGALCIGAAPHALAQATSRTCPQAADDQPGPACLMAHQPLGALSGPAVYWQLRSYPNVAAAEAARNSDGAVAVAFGQVWLFTVGPQGAGPADVKPVAEVGPIPVDNGTAYDAEFLKSTFDPGMRAPVHIHSGPEAFYAISGDTCLETPDGVQRGRGPGNSLVVRRGPPMLLVAPGPEPRKGFALILHDRSLPPTTLVQHWQPKGLCQPHAGSD